MIQRIQSLYLLLSAAAGAAVCYFDLWKAKVTRGANISDEYFSATSNYLIFILLMISVGLSVFCIFLFKNRKLQFRLTVFNMLIAIGVMALIYLKVEDKAKELMNGATLVSDSYLVPAFLPVVMIVLLFMAARGIYKDERLIKSLDRLR